MAFSKYASLDIGQVLEVRSAPERQEGASLAKFGSYNDYRTDDGYIYTRVRAISSRVNKNFDGWPSEELQKAYRTFIGKPIFVDHHNSDPKKSRGVIVDAILHVEDDKVSAHDPYYSTAPDNHKPPTWIELLLETDANKFPKLAKAIVDGDIDGVSMGCNVEKTACSICNNEAYSPEDFCTHVKLKGAHFDHFDHMGRKTSKLAYEDCYDIGFFEISYVFDPADETALVHEVKSSKTAAYPFNDDEFIDDDDDDEPYSPDPYNNVGEPEGEIFHDQRGTDLSKVPHWFLNSEDPAHQREMQRRRDQMEGKDLQFYHENEFNAAPSSDVPDAPPDDWSVYDLPETTAPPATGKGYRDWSNPAVRSEFVDEGGTPVMNDVGVDIDAAPVAFDPRRDAPGTPAPAWGEHQQHYDFLRDALRNGHAPADLLHYMTNNKGLDPTLVSRMLRSLEWDTGHQASIIDRVLKEAGFKLAENPLPQSMEVTVPEHVDTLRQEKVCPVCGSEMDSGECAVCHYEEPPAGFDNPDLGLAQQVRDMLEQSGENLAQGGQPPMMIPPGMGPPGNAGDPMQGTPGPPSPGTMVSSTKNDTNPHDVKDKWGVVIRSRVASRIDKRELPILPPTRITSDLPVNPKVITNSSRPVESNTKDNKNNMSDWDAITAKLAASGHSPEVVAKLVEAGVIDKLVERLAADAVAEPADYRTDVDSQSQVGGDPTNDAEHVDVEKPLKEEVGDHTQTWGDNSTDAVTSEDGSVGQGPIGTPIHSTKQANPIPGSEVPFKPDARIDVEKPLNKEEVGDKTQTWKSDDFHITDPVTTDGNGNNMGGPIGQAVSKAQAKWTKALKIAEVEVSLGIIPEEEKYDRLAILNQETDTALDATLNTLSMVRKANLQKKAKRVTPVPPGLGQVTASTPAPAPETTDVGDEALFM